MSPSICRESTCIAQYSVNVRHVSPYTHTNWTTCNSQIMYVSNGCSVFIIDNTYKAVYTLSECVWSNTSERVHLPSVDFAANVNEHIWSCLFTVANIKGNSWRMTNKCTLLAYICHVWTSGDARSTVANARRRTFTKIRSLLFGSTFVKYIRNFTGVIDRRLRCFTGNMFYSVQMTRVGTSQWKIKKNYFIDVDRNRTCHTRNGEVWCCCKCYHILICHIFQLFLTLRTG